jgi:light-regulated signal transduction histidine kinase (bacteriophytochrome)
MASDRVDMEALVARSIKDLETAVAGRTVNFRIGKLVPARGDAAMLQRVWANLLDNAVKYTGKTTEAKISVGSEPGASETIYFVRDNGAGFDMKYVGRLFGAFQRLHGDEFPGTGIGLAVVKRIVTRHGGRVWAEGKLNEGATFFFALPRQEEEQKNA